MNVRGIWVAGIAAALAGCPNTPTADDAGFDGGGGAGGADGGGGGDAAAARAWCEAITGVYCDYWIACAVVDPAARAACVSVLKVDFCRGAEAVALGARSFDGQKAQACLAAAQAATIDCAQELDVPGCGDLFTPAAQRGQRCARYDDCVDPTDVCLGPPCGSVCLATGGLNQPCRPQHLGGSGCEDGLWCDDQGQVCRAALPLGDSCNDDAFSSQQCDADGRCDGTTCVALPVDGDSCRFDYHRPCASGHYCDSINTCRLHLALGQACDHPQACGPEATCRFENGTNTCAARVGAGGGCASESDCHQGLRCSSGQCAERAAQGQACGSDADCAQGLGCDQVLHTCQTFEYSSGGGPCTGDTKQCAGAATDCVGVAENPDGGVGSAGTCTARTVGSPCQVNWECPRPGFCDLSAGAGSCQTAALGSPCDGYYNCQPQHYCAQGMTCVERKAAGSACTSSDECLPPDACLGAQGTRTCSRPKGEGEACGSNDMCLFPHNCLMATCAPTGGQGQPCYDDVVCIQGACQSADGGTQQSCGPLAQGGDACNYDYDCASGSCEEAGLCAPVCT